MLSCRRQKRDLRMVCSCDKCNGETAMRVLPINALVVESVVTCRGRGLNVSFRVCLGRAEDKGKEETE